MRFLHLADLHLDTSFAGRRPELRERLREAARQALSAAVERALTERVDAVLVAGDLFDGDRLSFRTERLLIESMERLVSAGIDVVYATGNHDPGAGGDAARIPWPDGMVLVAGPEPRRVPITRSERTVGWVTAAGHASPREGRDLSQTFPRPEGALPEVALLHTQVLGSRGEAAHDRYAPSELSHLRRAGFDYWALGHIHLRQELSADPPVHYPGNLQGRHPGEDGPKGGLLVELERGSAARIRFLDLAPLRWETLRVGSLEGATHLEALGAAVERAWEHAREADPGSPGTEWLLRVRLEGPSPLYRELGRREDRRELEREIRVGLGVLDAEIRPEAVRPPLDPADHRDRVDVLGESLALLEAVEKGETGPAALLGIEPSDLAGFEQGRSGAGDPDQARSELDRYVAKLLRGEAPALLDALLERGSER